MTNLDELRRNATVGWSATDYRYQQEQMEMAKQRKKPETAAQAATEVVEKVAEDLSMPGENGSGDAKKPKRGRRPKQSYIPGTEPPSHKDIDEAAEEYRETRDKRMKLTQLETEQNDALLALMKKHGLTEYEFDGYTVEVANTQKVKVKRKKDASENGDGEDDD